MRKLIALLIGISLLLTTACPPAKAGKKGLGLVETPKMLYKSFRAAGSKAYGGAAPELAGDVDLSPLFPAPGDQGQIGSCTAWTTAYACKSYHENLERKWGADASEHLFSPSFIYNQINGGVDAGAPLEYAINVVMNFGCATLTTMPYTANYRQAPSQAAFNEAIEYKARAFARVDSTDLAAVKAVLAGGNPLLIGMMIYENLYDYKGGIYKETDGPSLGGHAMCVLGYDNAKSAFKIINSWGTYWGEQGYLWVDYELFKRDVVTCLVMYDEVVAKPQIAAPPVNIEAGQGADAKQIRVVWNKSVNATAYKVFRSDNPSSYFTAVADTLGTTYIDTNVLPGVIWYYAVKSVSAGGESDFSDSAKGYAGSLEAEVGIPQDLIAAYADNAVYLKWNGVSNAAGYYVYRFDKEKEDYVRTGETLDTSFRDSAKFNDKELVWYLVTAYKGSRESEVSNPVSVTVISESKIIQLKAPRVIKASQGQFKNEIKVAWRKVEDATAYKFYKWYVQEEKWKFITELTTTTYDDVEPGTVEAYYLVTAKNGDVVSGPSEPAWGWTSAYKQKQKTVKYDDAQYYDDKDYFEDTNYKDDSKYNDDKRVDPGTGNTTQSDKKDQPVITTGKTESEADKFITEKEALDNVRQQVNKNNDKPATNLQNTVKDAMSKEGDAFFDDESDEDFFNDKSDENFFGDDEDF